MLFNKAFFLLLTILYLQSLCSGDIVSRLKKRYYDTRTVCKARGKKVPAYECSGIMIRGINENSNLPHAWSLKPRNKEKNSFSVAYLRKDTRFSGFPGGYNAGFIIYPHLSTPKKKNKYKVFCAFPMDGYTDVRGGEHACGQSDGDVFGTSKHCDELGITSYATWVDHFKRITQTGGNLEIKQCAFDMTIKSAAQDFATLLKANSYLRTSNKFPLKNNELVFHGWNEEEPKNIPIEAFFYLLDKKGAYDNAKKFQKDFQKLGGGKMPIVGIRLPTGTNPKLHIKKKQEPLVSSLLEALFDYDSY